MCKFIFLKTGIFKMIEQTQLMWSYSLPIYGLTWEVLKEIVDQQRNKF